jgi:hypothetical protein
MGAAGRGGIGTFPESAAGNCVIYGPGCEAYSNVAS